MKRVGARKRPGHGIQDRITPRMAPAETPDGQHGTTNRPMALKGVQGVVLTGRDKSTGSGTTIHDALVTTYPASYTQLTLPTAPYVEITGVAVSCKKQNRNNPRGLKPVADSAGATTGKGFDGGRE